jgi:hypothetical protein
VGWHLVSATAWLSDELSQPLQAQHTSVQSSLFQALCNRSRFQGFTTVAALVEKFSLSALPAVSKVTHIRAPYLPKDDVSKNVITVKWLQIEPESMKP